MEIHLLVLVESPLQGFFSLLMPRFDSLCSHLYLGSKLCLHEREILLVCIMISLRLNCNTKISMTFPIAVAGHGATVTHVTGRKISD